MSVWDQGTFLDPDTIIKLVAFGGLSRELGRLKEVRPGLAVMITIC